jgi:hypothetical protein
MTGLSGRRQNDSLLISPVYLEQVQLLLPGIVTDLHAAAAATTAATTAAATQGRNIPVAARRNPVQLITWRQIDFRLPGKRSIE